MQGCGSKEQVTTLWGHLVPLLYSIRGIVALCFKRAFIMCTICYQIWKYFSFGEVPLPLDSSSAVLKFPIQHNI